MSVETNLPDYDRKPADYFQYVRPEMLAFVPVDCHRVLDVGCAGGAFGEALRRTRGVEVWGVEPTSSAAANAKSRLDNVVENTFENAADLPVAFFDCICFNDVLEHMRAPEKALRYARSLLSPSGVVVASLPNIRSFPTVWQLLVHSSWDYTDSGVLDETHLRFFTKSSIIRMFESEGYVLERIQGINAYCGSPNFGRPLRLAYRLANTVFLGKITDMKFQQFAVVARPATRS